MNRDWRIEAHRIEGMETVMDTLLAVKLGYFAMWAIFSLGALRFARRHDARERLRRPGAR
jgi:hypothetical protein